MSGEEFLPPPLNGVQGWDLTLIEWWMMPSGLSQMEPLVYSWLTPPEGCNIFPWLDEIADELLWEGMHTLNADQRKMYLWFWQGQFMHNPPMANLYYPRFYEVIADWVGGWDAVVRFRDISHLTLNNTMLAEIRPDRDPNTLIYAVSEPLWGMNPLFVETCTEEWMCTLWFDTLYDLSIEPWPPTGQEPAPWDFYSKPALAAAPPVFMDGPNGPNTRARILLRDNTYWSNGVKLNATDVKFTLDLILNPAAKAVAHGKLSHVVESVEIVNETCADLILCAPHYADLMTLLSDNWGSAILPYHFLKDIPVDGLRAHPSNTAFGDPSAWMPVSGPYKPLEIVPDDQVTFEKNNDYYGYGLGWGPYNCSTLILDWIPDAAVRMLALQTNDVDFGEYPTAPVEVFQDMMNQTKWPHLRVWQYDSPVSNPVLFNFNNPYLSNRYVRQAIAHAIPYSQIISHVLPSGGIDAAYRGKALVTPLHYYTDPSNVTVHLFNEDLQPYEYNISKAQMYMNMWKYSQVGSDYTLGPIGDADFSGLVDLDDFYIWRGWLGTYPDDWKYLPGQDVDPDFDNNGYVELADFYRWV
ncbi:MAG: ABC transporter substrate-binding protein, partial [Candidatus Bathyarchaeota archaeon]